MKAPVLTVELNTADEKRFTTLRAHLAMRGFALTRTSKQEGGCLLITAWNLARSCPDLSDVEAFAKRVGANV